jgi:RNA 2',3'-cyclic 3'-phosphodiesterase
MRLFVAIDIDDDVQAAVAKLQQELKGRMKNQNGLKWVNPELMHLTLKFLGEADENRVDEISDAVEIACGDKKVFEFSLSTVGTFGRPVKVLWLGNEEPGEKIVRLAADIEQALEQLGFEKEDRPFSAHLTLARVKDSGVDKNLRQLLKNYARVQIPKVLVDSVCLYKSQLTPHLPNIHKIGQKEGAGLTSDGPVYTLLRKIELKKDI